jgi:hypothetical protein
MSEHVRVPLPSDKGKTVYDIVDADLRSGVVVDVINSGYVSFRDGVTITHWQARVRHDDDRERLTKIPEPLCFCAVTALQRSITSEERKLDNLELEVSRLRGSLSRLRGQLGQVEAQKRAPAGDAACARARQGSTPEVTSEGGRVRPVEPTYTEEGR